MSVNDRQKNKYNHEKFVAYFEEIATNLQAIGHSETSNHFSEFDALEEFEDERTDLESPFLLLENPAFVTINNTGNNILWRWRGAFTIASECQEGNRTEEHAAKSLATDLVQKVTAKMRADRKLQKLFDVDLTSIRGNMVQQMFRNAHGVRVQFEFTTQIDLRMYDADWINEDGALPVPPFATVIDGAETIELEEGESHTCAAGGGGPDPVGTTSTVNGVSTGVTTEDGGVTAITVTQDGNPAPGTLVAEEFQVYPCPTPDGTTTRVNGVLTGVTTEDGGVTAITVTQNGDPAPGELVEEEFQVTPPEGTTATVNGASTGVTTEDGGVAAITVTQGGNPAPGTLVGEEFQVDACPTVETLAVTLSNEEPDLGEEVTITATPSGFVTPSYSFYIPQSDGSYVRTDQASTTLDWTVDLGGEWTVIVIATEGALIACDEATGATNVDSAATDFISAHNAETSLTMHATQQAAVIGLIERLKGTGTPNGNDVFTKIKNAGGRMYIACPTDDSTISANGCKIDLLNPLNFGVYSGFVSGDFVPEGVTGGSGKTFRSGVSPDDFAQNDISVHFYNRSNIISNVQIDCGVGSVTDFSIFSRYSSTQAIMRVNEAGFPGFTVISDYLGLLSYVREDSANTKYYVDGVLHATETSGSEPPVADEICFHADGTGATNPSSRQFAACIVAPSLNADEMADLGSAMTWYQQNVITGGRDV